MIKVLCSTGAMLSPKNGRDINIAEKYAPLLKCGGYEFLMYGSMYENFRQTARRLSEAGLRFPVFHTEKTVGELIGRNGDGDIKRAEELFRENCEFAAMLGAEKLVLHLWNGPPSDSNIEVNINEYGRLAETAEKMGLALTAENIPCRVRDPMTHFAALRERYPDVGFTLDVRHADFHGQLSDICAGKYDGLLKGSVRHIHISDRKGGCMDWNSLRCVPVGEGHIDLQGFLSYIKGTGYDGFITLEAPAVNPDGSIDTDKLNRSFDFIRKAVM